MELLETKVIYTGLFVNNQQELLDKIPATFEKTYAHHLTLKFRPENGTDGLEIGKQHSLKITGQVIDEEIGIQACLIEDADSNNKNPHITISSKEGVSPVKSNDAILKAIEQKSVIMFDEPIEIITTEGYFNGQTVILK